MQFATFAMALATLIVSMACDRGPSAPTLVPSSAFTSFTGDLTGTWIGEYAVTGCVPTTAPNRCTTYIPPAPETMTLTLAQAGSTLTGTFTSEIIGSLAVTGTVDEAGVVHLAGARPGAWRCFDPTSVRAIEIGDWTTEITKQGEMRGAFRQSSEQTLSSCYTGRYDYFTQVLSLRRSGAATIPPVDTVPPADSVRLSGRVLDYRTGSPVPSVSVNWHARSASYAVLGSDRAVSDQQGQYSVVLPPGASYYALTFEDPSISGWGIVRLPPGIRETDLLVFPPGVCNWVRYGTVIDAATERPLEGVRVDASGTSAVTRADGNYLLDAGCAARGGPINLVASRASYVTQGQFFFGDEATKAGIHRVDFALVRQ
jgi:hypothetical protein